MLSWANSFSICCFLDSHFYKDKNQRYDCLVAVGAKKKYCPQQNKLDAIKKIFAANNEWLFGHINYELKKETENVSAEKQSRIEFPDVFFFVPEIILKLSGNTVTIISSSENDDVVFEKINNYKPLKENYNLHQPQIKSAYSKEEYVEIINRLKAHILRGDCYEINFCMEFFAENVLLNAAVVHEKLVTLSPTPFSCFYKLDEKYLLCASPERYIKKSGTKILSQPIKGTITRALDNREHDETLKKELQSSAKDRSENVMIVDLVRNDLARICKKGTVQVEELFGVYSFAQVHQMISTISGEVDPHINFADVLKATFPMGSMTGAPKKRVLELIDEYEKIARNIFSGCVGYISPSNDFDFNVVIRSIMYNKKEKAISFMAGSGITFYSNPENEYEECFLKAKAMEQALTIDMTNPS